jgi:hypothetical protein
MATKTTKTEAAKPTKAAIARHLFIGVRALRRLIEENKLPSAGTLDEYREAAFRNLRAQAAGRGGVAADDMLGESRADARADERAKLRLAILKHSFIREETMHREVIDVLMVIRDNLANLAPLIANDVADRALPRHEVAEIVTKRVEHLVDLMQPDEIMTKAVAETETWIKQHGGRL